MKLAHPLVRLLDCSIDAIAAALPARDDPLWELNTYRQDKHAVHRATRSIILKWIDDKWQPGETAAVQNFLCTAPGLADAVHDCAAKLQVRLGGKIVRLMLTELGPHGKISPHRDFGFGTLLVHRCHVPVITNPEVRFFIDGVANYLQAGTAYEFDNTLLHAVDNDSDQPRIHLMCDILPASLVV